MKSLDKPGSENEEWERLYRSIKLEIQTLPNQLSTPMMKLLNLIHILKQKEIVERCGCPWCKEKH